MDYKYNHVAFVLGLFDTGLGAVRSLGYNGIPVIGLDPNPQMPGFKSRFCKAKLCPDPVHQPSALLEFLMEEGRKLDKPGILFPSSDAFVLFLSRYREELKTSFRFALPSKEILEAIVNKRKQYEMAEEVGTPYPQTLYYENPDDIDRIKNKIEYPAFIKPYYSHLWREKFQNKGFKVNTPEELSSKLEEILPTGLQIMVQSIILGPNTNHFKVSAYMGKNNEPLAVFTLRKIRQYPVDFGVGTLVESLHYDELKELGMKFFRGIQYRGIGSIEFKKDDRDGRLKMIELNPRLWQQNYHATRCGMNFPLIQYLDLTEKKLEPQMKFITGIKWFDAISDFQAFWDYFHNKQLSPWAWIRSWIDAKSFATFAWNDLGPFLKANEYGLKYLRLPLYLLR